MRSESPMILMNPRGLCSYRPMGSKEDHLPFWRASLVLLKRILHIHIRIRPQFLDPLPPIT
jgi:hypothetical protein